MINYTDREPIEDKPFGSKALKSCFEQGAARFGWAQRSPEPRSMRDGRELVGGGVASGIWEALMMPSKVRAVLTADGKLELGNATGDIGTGTYTILTQIGADTLGLPMEDVTTKLGDTSLAEAPVAGGSWTAASSGTAAMKACREIASQVFVLARRMDNSPLANADFDRVVFTNGRIALADDPSRSVAIIDAMKAGGHDRIEVTGEAGPDSDFAKEFECFTHQAVFVEVKVDEELGQVRVTRVVSAIAAGKILNPKTARSQIIGATVMGIGSALHEESMLDHTLGRWMNRNLGEYHVPANADIHDLDVIFVDEEDKANPLGVKGVGEMASSARRRPSPTRCIMPPASASATCRSPSRSSCRAGFSLVIASEREAIQGRRSVVRRSATLGCFTCVGNDEEGERPCCYNPGASGRSSRRSSRR